MGLSDEHDPQLRTLTSGAIRKAVVEYGRLHEDPLIQKFMPRMMRHSKETADKFYRSDEGNQLSLRLANALDGAPYKERVSLSD